MFLLCSFPVPHNRFRDPLASTQQVCKTTLIQWISFSHGRLPSYKIFTVKINYTICYTSFCKRVFALLKIKSCFCNIKITRPNIQITPSKNIWISGHGLVNIVQMFHSSSFISKFMCLFEKRVIPVQILHFAPITASVNMSHPPCAHATFLAASLLHQRQGITPATLSLCRLGTIKKITHFFLLIFI